jgi:hypothetical protein
VLDKYPAQTLARMNEELRRQPDWWRDAPLDPAWKEVNAQLCREVEQAGGLLTKRFALCQALPLERLQAVTEGLRPAGYRPVRVRPWNVAATGPVAGWQAGRLPLRVGVVWTRDNSDWRLQTGLTAPQVQARQPGLVAADMAGYRTPEGDRYALLLRKPGKGEQVVAYAGVPAAKHRSQIGRYKANDYIPATVQTLTASDGSIRHSGVWWKGPDKPEGWQLWLDDTESKHDDRVLAGEQLLLDVHLNRASASASQFAWVAGLIAAPGSLAALAQPLFDRDFVPTARALLHYASV